jgi:hypothetical protein
VAWSAGDLAVLEADRPDDPSESEPT